jgi:hypothetical protein
MLKLKNIIFEDNRVLLSDLETKFENALRDLIAQATAGQDTEGKRKELMSWFHNVLIGSEMDSERPALTPEIPAKPQRKAGGTMRSLVKPRV